MNCNQESSLWSPRHIIKKMGKGERGKERGREGENRTKEKVLSLWLQFRRKLSEPQRSVQDGECALKGREKVFWNKYHSVSTEHDRESLFFPELKFEQSEHCLKRSPSLPHYELVWSRNTSFHSNLSTCFPTKTLPCLPTLFLKPLL